MFIYWQEHSLLFVQIAGHYEVIRIDTEGTCRYSPLEAEIEDIGTIGVTTLHEQELTVSIGSNS